jgi:prevent-host-death family protein
VRTLSVGEAKAGLSEILGAVAYRGDSFVIAKRGRPMALLVPVSETRPHLADAHGWLDDDDEFFREVERLETRRESDTPRPAPELD